MCRPLPLCVNIVMKLKGTHSLYETYSAIPQTATIHSAAADSEAIKAAKQWLPFTPNRDFLGEPRMFTSAHGTWYKSEDGRAIFDASSGLLTTPAGHGRTDIADAVYEQILELDFTPAFCEPIQSPSRPPSGLQNCCRMESIRYFSSTLDLRPSTRR